MQWMKEVELVDSVDDLQSSSSIRGISMPNFEVLDARIASARNKIIPLQKENQSGETKGPEAGRGRQIAYLIYQYFRVTGAHDSVENYADLFIIVLRNDDIQEFHPKWDGISLSMTKIPPDDILDGLYNLRIRVSEKLKTVLELYDLEIHQKKLGPDYHRLKTMVRRSIEQDIRNKTFGARNGNYEKNAVVKNQGTKQRVQRILGDCWQWESNGQCKRRQLQFRHDINKREKVTPSNPSPNSFMQQNERKASRTRSPRGRSPSGRTSRWPCKDYLRGTCNNSFCEKWHPPECLFYKTKSGRRSGEKCSYAHRQVDEQKGPKRMMTKVPWLYWKRVIGMNENLLPTKVTIDQGNLVTEVIKSWNEDLLNVNLLMHGNWVAYFRTWRRRSLFSGRAPTCRSQSNVWNSQRLLHVTPKFETKILRSDIFAQVNLMSVAPTFQNLSIGLRRRQSGKSKVPAKQRGSWPKECSNWRSMKEQHSSHLSENRRLPASTLKPEEREFVVDSGASMHMISKKDLSDAEMVTLTKSCSPTIVITANGEVQTHEEAIVYVTELGIILTMKVLENTPAVLSLGKLCDDNRYSYEWINGQKPHLIKDGIRLICNTENFVPIVVPGLSSSSSGSSSTLRTSMKQESHSSSSSSPSSPTVGEIQVREREDATNRDISPVPMSNQGNLRKSKPTKSKNQIERKPR